MAKLKLKKKGKKTYKNTHGTIYRVKTKPNYKSIKKISKKQIVRVQTDS